MIESPLRLPNGKFRVREQIVSLFPKNIREYRDVRMSSGHPSFFFINKSSSELPDKIWLNDENPDVVNFFKYASYMNAEVIEKINNIMGDFKEKELFLKCKEILKTEKSKYIGEDFVSEAMAFFIINRLSFAGTLTGGYCKSNWVNGKTPRLTQSAIARLKTLDGFIKRGLQLTCMDCTIPIVAPTKFKDEEVFILVNPPFYNKNMQMYPKSKSDGNKFDYERLAKNLAITPYKYMVVIDDSKETRDFFSFGNIISLTRDDSGIYPNAIKRKSLICITNY